MVGPEADDTISNEDAERIHEAISGAIGWIAAGTNEGNNDISQYTRRQLVRAGKHFWRMYKDAAK